jgi:hypothetical protein
MDRYLSLQLEKPLQSPTPLFSAKIIAPRAPHWRTRSNPDACRVRKIGGFWQLIIWHWQYAGAVMMLTHPV